ncbi:DUF2254 domain-containing protein [Litorimonas sp. RW-G-Af-16]|uniref:DUF2254 domain-containing protein n=1 Tax=Litorimonas sp. RW-G-Af-16 TaxID=3241168 RepID=UPI00390C7D51
MNARLIKVWQDLQSSYYFIPGLMAVGSIALAYLTIHLDEQYGLKVSEFGFFLSNKADGARTILATIAGSMMGVAATTFSITMVAVTSAAGQYGPRLIGNFMRDRGNQVTLGTFTSTFIYCLLILRVARTGDSGTGENMVAEFVPNISLLTAMGLTLTSVGVLIYFIHHVPETLNVGNITGRVGRRLRNDIESLYPRDLGEQNKDKDVDLSQFSLSDAKDIRSNAEGYIQTVNEDALLDLANEHDAVVKIEYRPGDFVTQNDVLVRIWRDEELDEDAQQKYRNAYAMGQDRTAHQNILFLADELVEILARALSPGVNDPFTAINCINWFQSAMKAFLRGNMPSPFRRDEDGALRVIAYPINFERFASVLCDQSRAYIATDRNTTLKMMTILTELAAQTDSEPEKTILIEHLKKLKIASLEACKSSPDSDDIEARFQRALRMTTDTDYFRHEQSSQRWIGGRG